MIVCGHFVDGAEKFTPATVENETKPEWYLRQMLGTANFNAGPVLRFMSGNLCYQIEHHLFPDLPSNRLPEISLRVQAILAEYDLPYTTGPLIRQFWHTVRTICKLSLPDRFLMATSHDAPETASEEKFRDTALQPKVFGAHDVGTTRRGLDTAIIDRAGLRMKQRRRRHASLRCGCRGRASASVVTDVGAQRDQLTRTVAAPAMWSRTACAAAIAVTGLDGVDDVVMPFGIHVLDGAVDAGEHDRHPDAALQ